MKDTKIDGLESTLSPSSVYQFTKFSQKKSTKLLPVEFGVFNSFNWFKLILINWLIDLITWGISTSSFKNLFLYRIDV